MRHQWKTKLSKLIEDIKKLLILDLVAKGVQAGQIGEVLGVDRTTITRIAPARKMKKNYRLPRLGEMLKEVPKNGYSTDN
jgi:DNA-binding transcriptional ArsR family regulator